jgi:hypothetical protein
LAEKGCKLIQNEFKKFPNFLKKFIELPKAFNPIKIPIFPKKPNIIISKGKY